MFMELEPFLLFWVHQATESEHAKWKYLQDNISTNKRGKYELSWQDLIQYQYNSGFKGKKILSLSRFV